MISFDKYFVDMNESSKAFLSVAEAAEFLGISKATLHRMSDSGELNPIKTPGGHRRFSIEELSAYKISSKDIKSSLNPSKFKNMQMKIDSSEGYDLSKSSDESDLDDEDKSNEKEGSYDPRNTLNDLTGKEWMPETKSYFFQKGLGANHPEAQIEKLHPAPYSYQDISHLVTFFTKHGEMVLDPFGGVGSTAKACAVNGRYCTQIELTEKWHDLAIKRLETEVGIGESSKHQFILGDSVQVLPTFESNTFDFMVTSPPYWGILNKKPDHKVMDRVKNNLDLNYSDSDSDLGNISDYQEFVDILVNKVFLECARTLKPKKYMCIVVSDFRDKSRFISFHSDLIMALDGAITSDNYEITLQGIKVLLQNHKSLKPYGYPFAYVENIHHQYVLIFRKMPVKKG